MLEARARHADRALLRQARGGGVPGPGGVGGRAACSTTPTAGVVALGGGAVYSERVRKALDRHIVVWLEVSAEEAWRRVEGSGRPLARDRERFEALHAEREPIYARARRRRPALRPTRGWSAGRCRRCSGSASCRTGPGWPGRTAPRASTRPSWGRGSSAQAGGRSQGRALLRRRHDGRGPLRRRRRAGGRTGRRGARGAGKDAGRGRASAARARAAGDAPRRPPGRPRRRRRRATSAASAPPPTSAGWRWCRCRRRSWRRWTPPTAARPASTSPRPRTTSAHTTCRAPCWPTRPRLRRCPPRSWRPASSRWSRRRCIAGGELWERVRGLGDLDPADLDAVVFACARTKLEVVAADERDAGRRAVLNLGHTVGHAIEAATGYERYRHGEAVGLGLLAALRLSGAGELRDEVDGILSSHGPADEPRRCGRRRRGDRGGRARQEADGGRRRLRAPPRAQASRASAQRVEPDALRGRVEELR